MFSIVPIFCWVLSTFYENWLYHIESVYTSHKCHEMRRKLHHVITLHNNEEETEEKFAM